MGSGESPAQEMVEGLALLLAGILLFLPGFISDGVGVFLLIPGLRGALAGRLVKPLVQSRFVKTQYYYHRQDNGETFEGEYRRTDESQNGDDKKNNNFLP